MNYYEVKNLIAKLSKIDLSSKTKSGGKAAVLGELIKAGHNVPFGYSLSVEVFTLFLKHNNFPYTPEQYISHNDKIIEFIINGRFPKEISENIRRIYYELTDITPMKTLVVRSSAMCEDTKTSSMAGIFESFIEISSFDELELSIKKCYASLFSDRALAFIIRNNIPVQSLQMGVIVQQFIPGDISGVIFSADAVALSPDIMIINTVHGICMSFVDGSSSSSYYRIDKHSGEVVESVINPNTPLLTDDQINCLLNETLKIEQTLRDFQDIEWTINDKKLYILQSRPITSFEFSNYKFDWTNVNDDGYQWTLDETVEAPLLPLFEDLACINADAISIGLQYSGKNEGYLYKVVQGYPYYHFCPRDIKKREQFEDKLFKMFEQGENIFQDEVLPVIQEYRQNLNGYIKQSLDNSELLKFLNLSIEYFEKAKELHISAVDGCLYLEDFKAYCEKWIPGISSNEFYDLVYGESWLCKERQQIIQMANLVRSDDELSDIFKSQLYDEILYSHLPRLSKGHELIAVINDYMDDYGLMCINGQMQLSSPVIIEKPSSVINKIRVCLYIDTELFFRSIEETLSNKQKLIKYAETILPGSEITNFIFKLKSAEKAFLVNDDHCYFIDMMSQGYLRLALLEIAKVFVRNNILEKSDDIYYLKIDEIRNLFSGELSNAEQLITERKDIIKQQKMLYPPNKLGNVASSAEHQKSKSIDNCSLLNGISGLNKKVRGRVTVIQNNMKGFTLKEKCILVLKHSHACYFLPMLNNIIGLIYDEGSPFDHPGIIARELQIPSIYSTKNATQVLNDGDEVEIDGVNGQVIVINRG